MEHDHVTQLRTENGETVIELPDDVLDTLDIGVGDDVELDERDGALHVSRAE